MCGIAGTSSLNRYTRSMLPFLAYSMEDRGDDSWGISNGTATVRALGPITGSYKIPHTFREGDQVVIHTRTASCGKVSIENQHPFFARGPAINILGVHNGGITNYRELADKTRDRLKAASLPYDFTYEVDSHALFAFLAAGGSPSDVRGAGALVWWEWKPRHQKRLNLLRFNMDALYVAKLSDSSLVWCSTKDPIEKAARMAGLAIVHFYTIKGDTRYQVQPETVDDATDLESGFPLVEIGPMVFGPRFVPTHSNYSGGWSDDNEWSTGSPQATHSDPFQYCDTPPKHSRPTPNAHLTCQCGWANGHPLLTIFDGPLAQHDRQLYDAVGKALHGPPQNCLLCGEPYHPDQKDSNPNPSTASLTIRTLSTFVCARCLHDKLYELSDAYSLAESGDPAESGSLPYVLGVNISPVDLPFDDTDDTDTSTTKELTHATTSPAGEPTAGNSAGNSAAAESPAAGSPATERPALPPGSTGAGPSGNSQDLTEGPRSNPSEPGVLEGALA